MGNLDESWYYTPLKLDCADGYISEPLLASPEDAHGRGIDLTLLQDFAPINTSGYHVDLEWQTVHGCGMEPFEEQTGTGRWRVTYPGAMLKPGFAWARIAVYLGESQVITSKRFRVKVEKNVIDLCLAEKDSDFSQFVQATIDIRELDDEMRNQAIRYSEAEDGREARYIKAEADRQNSYQSSESLRDSLYVTAESERQTAFVEAETIREEAEKDRLKSEEERKSEEVTRVANERRRITSENERIGRENVRLANEQNRISAEQKRIKAEDERIEAELYRSEKFDEYVKYTTTNEYIVSRVEFDSLVNQVAAFHGGYLVVAATLYAPAEKLSCVDEVATFAQGSITDELLTL